MISHPAGREGRWTSRRVRLLALACVGLLQAAAARAEPKKYGVRLAAESVTLRIPYTLGTHRERVTAVDGAVTLDPRTLELSGGRLVVPLSAIRSDDPTRECHLREALGLDYERSRYPREHVCDGADRLPAAGPEAIAFPAITLELTSGGPVPGGAAPDADGEVEVEARGTWSVHGVTRPAAVRLGVARDAATPGGLRVRGRHALRLYDFGVVVKPAKVLFVTISVADEVALELDLLLEPVNARAPPEEGGR